jgi:hypothetical protein
VTDTTIRRMTAAAVLLVADIAAVVSFIHVEHLAATHGRTLLAAMLLPLSIDGTVVAASLVMLRAARSGVRAPWLARLTVAATLAANVAYGARFGVAGALLSGWPAAAFIGSAEMALSMVRRATRTASPRPALEVTARPARKASTRATGRGQDAATDAARKASAEGHPVPSAPPTTASGRPATWC